jgi:hypothetical protein
MASRFRTFHAGINLKLNCMDTVVTFCTTDYFADALHSDKRNHTWRNSKERKVYVYHHRKYLALILVNKDYPDATSNEV